MNRCLLLALLAGMATCSAQRLPEDFDPLRAERQGRELVAELRSRVPAGNSTNTGTLEIRPRRGRETTEIRVRFTVHVAGDRWMACYEALGAETNGALNAFTIVNEPNQAGRYYRGVPVDIRSSSLLSDTQVATLPFAGSDFWVGDLGLDFLGWPGQRLLMKDMRRGQSCNVLESVNPDPPKGGYARIVSWLDIDTGGIVYAEAFDASRVRVKEFSPKSFKKVDGEWQLEEMRIEDLRSRSRSAIIFDLPHK